MSDNFYIYSTYGLTIKSCIKLPGFVLAELEKGAAADVDVYFRKITGPFLDKYFGDTPIYKAPGCDVRVSERAMCFEYDKDVTLLIANGREVMIDLNPDAHEEDILPYLTGYVLAVLLHQRNFLVLHASVVMVNNKTVAFLGAKGFGKSTLAASLQVKGYRLISDDSLPIVFQEDKVLSFPGYPQIKLFADSKCNGYKTGDGV